MTTHLADMYVRAVHACMVDRDTPYPLLRCLNWEEWADIQAWHDDNDTTPCAYAPLALQGYEHVLWAGCAWQPPTQPGWESHPSHAGP